MALTHGCSASALQRGHHGKRGRPCLEYDIKRCIAPCVDTICAPEEYARAVNLTQLFLEGKNDELVKTLRTRMLHAADGERFEERADAGPETVQRCMTVSRRWHRGTRPSRVFGVKLGPAVSRSRCSRSGAPRRRAHRAWHDEAIAGLREEA